MSFPFIRFPVYPFLPIALIAEHLSLGSFVPFVLKKTAAAASATVPALTFLIKKRKTPAFHSVSFLPEIEKYGIALAVLRGHKGFMKLSLRRQKPQIFSRQL